MTGLIIFGSLLIGMFMGLPVCFALLAACLIYLIPSGIPLTIVPQTMIAGMNSFVLLAIPLFTMTGYLMEQTSLSRRLVDFVEALFCRSRGSMGVVTIVTCAIFAALTGSGPATVAAIGAIMMPALTRANYPKSTSAGMIAAGGALGPIIPPSANMVVYGAAMGLSVSKMFIGGVLPGIMMAIALCLVNVYLAAKYKFAKSDVRYPKKEVLRRTARAIPTLVLPVIILGGIYGGLVTPTEAAVLSVLYALIYGFATKEIKVKVLWTVLSKTVLTSAVVTFIISVAKTFGWILSKTRLPAIIGEAIMEVIPNKWVYLAVLMALLFLVGCLMDTIPSIPDPGPHPGACGRTVRPGRAAPGRTVLHHPDGGLHHSALRHQPVYRGVHHGRVLHVGGQGSYPVHDRDDHLRADLRLRLAHHHLPARLYDGHINAHIRDPKEMYTNEIGIYRVRRSAAPHLA